jgi:FkbM family methyltransferase
MLARLVSLLPANMIRGIGRLQFKLPIVGPLISLVGRKITSTEGVIRHGSGAGLHFDAAGSSPGYLFGTSDPDEQACLERFLKPNDVFYDIGANVGFFAVIAARLVGPSGRVYAFEPFPESAAALRKNAALNGFTHLEVVESAVGAVSGKAKVMLGTWSGTNSVVFDHSNGGIEVPVLAIDDFGPCRRAPPKFVMIDVEGAEIEVLKGMLKTLATSRPVVLCEVHWIGDAVLAFHKEHLAPIGYRIRPLVGVSFPTSPQRFHVLLEPSAG